MGQGFRFAGHGRGQVTSYKGSGGGWIGSRPNVLLSSDGGQRQSPDE